MGYYRGTGLWPVHRRDACATLSGQGMGRSSGWPHLSFPRKRESGGDSSAVRIWIPTCAGMTYPPSAIRHPRQGRVESGGD
jgi:hypothetical protein